jgi:hypothetical protein
MSIVLKHGEWTKAKPKSHDIGISWHNTKGDRFTVTNEKLFFLAVIKYGIIFEVVNE